MTAIINFPNILKLNGMRQHRPYGPAPTALEANVLKLRALEMILIVFYMEDLRRFIIKAVTLTNQFKQSALNRPGFRGGQLL